MPVDNGIGSTPALGEGTGDLIAWAEVVVIMVLSTLCAANAIGGSYTPYIKGVHVDHSGCKSTIWVGIAMTGLQSIMEQLGPAKSPL